ncbi:hypothetical protein, partial [Methanococcus voltae]|uniref:hypothetical protein n=1 Tax=Methanococcus voltae TaxID=2188 RepID=UPI001AEB7FD2
RIESPTASGRLAFSQIEDLIFLIHFKSIKGFLRVKRVKRVWHNPLKQGLKAQLPLGDWHLVKSKI